MIICISASWIWAVYHIHHIVICIFVLFFKSDAHAILLYWHFAFLLDIGKVMEINKTLKGHWKVMDIF